MKLAKDKVSFKIRLAAFQTSGGAETYKLRFCCPAEATFSERSLEESIGL